MTNKINIVLNNNSVMKTNSSHLMVNNKFINSWTMIN